jgi:predicted dehydrogenase
MTKNLRVGVAGAGFIGAVHARAYLQVPGVELVGVADPIGEKAAKLAKETDCRPFRDYDELLKAGLDIISICLPLKHLGA